VQQNRIGAIPGGLGRRCAVGQVIIAAAIFS
jgi:hypothetical protein